MNHKLWERKTGMEGREMTKTDRKSRQCRRAGKRITCKKALTALLMLSIVWCFAACGGEKETTPEALQGSLSEVMGSLYEKADLDPDFRESLEYYETYELTDEMEASILGTDEITYTEGVVSMPLMSSTAYQCVLLRVAEDDVETVKQTLQTNADPNKWICVSAETTLIESRGEVIFFIMSDEKTAYAMNSAFQNL